ncbi:hypothetical protein HYW99_02870 [Candidatus Woesearchaeota archaeon]|nr:hypothetical protein [Candidatus Woesearchaeota archaeon]
MDKSDGGLVAGGGLAAIVAITVLGLGAFGTAALTLSGAYIGHELASYKHNQQHQYK